MASPFNIPDEFVQGFIKAGHSLWQAMLPGIAVQSPASVTPPVSDATSSGQAGRLTELQLAYFQQQFALWTRMMAQTADQPVEPVVSPDRGDRRFRDAEWRDNPSYYLLQQSYLLNSRLIGELVEAAELDEPTKQRLRFYSRQFIDSMSPTNFAATNPEVFKLALETGGESLKHGFENLLADMGKGGLTITDESAFEVGVNVVVSEGAVIFENELFQLIQYAPLTDQVATRPLVIVPLCINKFYILDLQPENSFVRFATEQGQTVFLISWRNPDASGGHLTWDDYIEQGVIKAISVARKVTGADRVNALGWCVGGTLLSSPLAVLCGRGDPSVSSLTLLTTMLDFSNPGDLGVLIDEQGVRAREETIGRGGIYPGAELGAGVINPAAKNKRSYWTGGQQGDDPEQWLAGSSETPGSWWSHWIEWLTPMAGEKVAARRQPGSKKFPVIEPAPGRYVKVRAR